MLISGCFACFFPSTCCCTVCLQKEKFHFPLHGLADLSGKKKQRIISAVAEGCREVVWHRHWLSLLRSEGIVRLREKRKKKKERKGAKWVSEWTKLQIGLDEMQVSWGCAGFYLFIYFIYSFIFLQHVVQVGPAISHASLTPGRRGERMDKQITDHQEEAELDHVPHCLFAGLSFHSWAII